MKKNIIFIGSMVDKNENNLVSQLAWPGVNMQKRIIEELEKYDDIKVHVISVLPILAYPVCKLKEVEQKKIHITDRTDGIQIGFKNIRIFRQIEQYIKVKNQLRNYIQETKGTIILIYNAYINISLPALKQRRNGIKVYSILADLPVSGEKYKKGLNKFLMGIYIYLTKKYVTECDGLIVLNKQAAEKYAPTVPYIVMEGGFDVSKKNNIIPYDKRKKDIIYTGSLLEYNGVFNLIKAMKFIKDSNVRLRIYGKGDLAGVIKEETKNMTNVYFGGFLDKEKLFEIQRNSYILVNPRNIQEEIGQVCFPSKIFEYLASGTVVLSTELSGLEEYFPYLYHIPSNTPEQLASKLKIILESPYEELESIARNARNFIIEEKSWKQQVNKIYKFIIGK